MSTVRPTGSVRLAATLACSTAALVALNLSTAAGDEDDPPGTDVSSASDLRCNQEEQLVVLLLNTINPKDRVDDTAAGSKSTPSDPQPTVDQAIKTIADGPAIPGDAQDLNSAVVESSSDHRVVALSDDARQRATVTLIGSPTAGWVPSRIEVCQA